MVSVVRCLRLFGMHLRAGHGMVRIIEFVKVDPAGNVYSLSCSSLRLLNVSGCVLRPPNL
jgi:hypothetical protein